MASHLVDTFRLQYPCQIATMPLLNLSRTGAGIVKGIHVISEQVWPWRTYLNVDFSFDLAPWCLGRRSPKWLRLCSLKGAHLSWMETSHLQLDDDGQRPLNHLHLPNEDEP